MVMMELGGWRLRMVSMPVVVASVWLSVMLRPHALESEELGLKT